MFFFLVLNSVWDPSPTLHLLGLACRDSAAYGCLVSPVCPTTTWATLTIFPDMTSGISYVSLFLKVKNKKMILLFGSVFLFRESLVIEGSTGVASRIAEGSCGNYQYLYDDS